MKILNINSYYYSSSVHKQLHQALLADNIDLQTYVPLAKNYIPRDECLYEDEEMIYSSECYNSRDRYIFRVKHKKIFNDILKRYDFKEIHCLHAHSLFSNGYIALQIKKTFGIPYIVAVRDTDLNVFFKKMLHLRKMGIEILKEADKIIFLSKPYRDIVIEKYVPANFRKEIFNKTRIIPNGIAEFWLKNKGYSKTYFKQEELRLVYIGAINKRKNIITTIKAIEILKKKGYDVKFTVVGRIEDKSIYSQIKDIPYINYLLPIPKEELIEVYRANRIFVMPSRTETFGLVYAEAMSQGLPVVYTKGQGFDGQFEEGEVGYHVDCYNPNNIADRVIDIISNYEKTSKKCVELSDKFDWNKISIEYLKIYHNSKENRSL